MSTFIFILLYLLVGIVMSAICTKFEIPDNMCSIPFFRGIFALLWPILIIFVLIHVFSYIVDKVLMIFDRKKKENKK